MQKVIWQQKAKEIFFIKAAVYHMNNTSLHCQRASSTTASIPCSLNSGKLGKGELGLSSLPANRLQQLVTDKRPVGCQNQMAGQLLDEVAVIIYSWLFLCGIYIMFVLVFIGISSFVLAFQGSGTLVPCPPLVLCCFLFSVMDWMGHVQHRKNESVQAQCKLWP